ncbi:MAG: CHRD domain-containing protein [Planctomycetia bacterium]|nr:CHRD domain-containing protein [Planctomycetia bacterium]
MKRMMSLACAVVALLTWSTHGQAAIVKYEVLLDGHQEVDSSGNPDKGDLDGTGFAQLWVDSEALSIDWNITAENIEFPLIGAHIHESPAGTNGSVKIDFDAQLTGSGKVDADLANLLANPTGFYVNLHNNSFTGGAIRGQIGQPVPEPTSLVLAGLGFVALALWRRK